LARPAATPVGYRDFDPPRAFARLSRGPEPRMVPVSIMVVPSLPKTANGKIDKQSLHA